MDSRLSKIIGKCQDARKLYSYDYENKFYKEIEKFSEEIIKNDLTKGDSYAKQLCITNSLSYDLTPHIWWEKLSFEEKYMNTIKWLSLYNADTTSKHPDTLTIREIEKVYWVYSKRILNNKKN